MSTDPEVRVKRSASLTGSAREKTLFQFIRNTFEHKASKFASTFAVKGEIFVLDEKAVKKIEGRAISEISARHDGEIEFEGEVLFPDDSSRKYDDVDILLNHSGDSFSIKNICLKWTYFDVVDSGFIDAGSIEIKFMVRNLERSTWSQEFIDKDSLSCAISGTNEEWVRRSENSFRTFFEGFVESQWAKLPRRVLCSFLIWFTLLFVIYWLLLIGYFGQGYITFLLFGPSEKATIIAMIQNEESIGEKLDLIAKLSVSVDDDGVRFFAPHIISSVGLSAFFSVLLCRIFFRVVPGSLIAIGERGAIALRDRDGWKALVTQLIGPITVSMLTGLFFWALG